MTNYYDIKFEREFLSSLRNEDRDRYLTLLFCPSPIRLPLAALAILNLELSRIPDITREPPIGLIRLQWWQDAIEATSRGDTRFYHPSLTAIAPLLKKEPRLVGFLQEMVGVREAELDLISAPEFTDFRRLANQGVGNLLRVWLLILDHTIDLQALEEGLSHIATAYAIAGILRAARRDALHNRVRIPASMLSDANVSIEDFLSTLSKDAESKKNPETLNLVLSLVQRGEQELKAASQCSWPKSARPALLIAKIARLYLRRLKRYRGNLFDERAIASQPLDIWRLLLTRISGRF